MKYIITILIALISLSANGQTRIHELPAKTNADSTWLILIGNPSTGRLYKMNFDNLKDSVIVAVGATTDTTSLSNRIDLKLNAIDTASLSARIDAIGGGGVGGSGTLNYTPKFTPDGTTLGNSQIYDNATSVGINTTNLVDPITGTSKFKVVDGTMIMSFKDHSGGTGGTGWLATSNGTITGFVGLTEPEQGFIVGSFTSHDFGIRTSNNLRFVIKANGIINLSAASRPVYADDTAAGVGGLVEGDLYQDSSGNLKIKQ